jgi:hypothetical protein
MLQFKRVSRCMTRYLTGMSLGVQVIWVFRIELLGIFWCNLRRVDILASVFVMNCGDDGDGAR